MCIDGPAGSGKTTLAGAVAELAGDARLVHMDDLFEGWDGLPSVDAQLDRLLRPLAEGRPGSFRRYDWDRARWAETVAVPPAPLVVLEGVGSALLETEGRGRSPCGTAPPDSAVHPVSASAASPRPR